MRKLLSLFICASMLLALIPAQNVKATEKDPKLIIEAYSLESTEVVYGEETVLHLTLHNMSATHTESEILLSFSSNGNVIPAMGLSNQTYIEAIEPDETVDVAIPIIFLSSNDGIVTMTFTIRYAVSDYEVNEVLSNTTYISFGITTGGKLEVSKVTVADTVTVGGKAIIGVGYTNSTKDTIEGAKMVVTYEGKNEIFDIGSVEGKKSGYYESYVSFTEVGNQEVKISIVYTDIAGRDVVISDETYNVNVVANTSAITDVDTNHTNSGTTSTVLLFAGVVILICGLFGFLKSRKK